MTLLKKNRGMPTLSLKGSVCVPLFLFLAFLQFSNPLYAQDLKNRTDDMYRLGRVIISPESLPDKVYRAQKNKILVSVLFFDKETGDPLTNSLGTGFVSETPGVIVTARHVLTESLVDMENQKREKIKINPKFDYIYVFMGTIITRDAWVNFPLFLIATGEKGTFKDMMVLRTDVATMQKAQIPETIDIPNPLSMLLKTSKFIEAKVGETVYVSGFSPLTSQYEDKKGQTVGVYIDMINFTFKAEVTAEITDMPINQAGVKILYRLRDSAEPGYSGGKVINVDGEVVGMTVAMNRSQNFIYVISSKDLKEFLKDNKLK